MKKTIKTILSAGLLSVVLTACSVSGPLFITDNPGGPGSKTGTASVNVYLGFIRPISADLSIKKAAENGNISKVSTVDQKIEAGFFKATYTTVVTGE